MSSSAPASSQYSCRHFGTCGGCDLLDRSYERELGEKHAELASLLQPVLPDAVKVAPVVPATEPYFTRTSLKLPFAKPTATTRAGFFERGTHRIVNLEECVVQHPRLTELILRTRALCDRQRVPIYQEQWHKGLLRHLVARVAQGTEELLAGFVVRRTGAPQIQKLAQSLYAEAKDLGLVGVLEVFQPEATNRVLGERAERLCGRPFLKEECDGLNLTSGILSFAQVNNAQARALYRQVLDILGDVEGAIIADLYSGAGPIALRIAQAGAHVIAVERNANAVREGRANARRNALEERLRFLADDAARAFPKLVEQGLQAVVVDPPRRGLPESLIHALLDHSCRTIVYVSCNPQTLLRDLTALSREYAVVRVVPVDLFPRTRHVETVVELRARGSG